MKAQILKIAGVKSEKEFYKKFPTEEAFMKKHGKELAKLKKAEVGDVIEYTDVEAGNNRKVIDGTELIQSTNKDVLGNFDQLKDRAYELGVNSMTTKDEKEDYEYKAKVDALYANQNSGGGLMDFLGSEQGMADITSIFGEGGGEGMSSMISGMAKKGGKVKKGYHKMPDGSLMKNSDHMKKGGKVEKFTPHMMYDPKTKKGKKAMTYKEHLALKKKGWGHDAPKAQGGKNVTEKVSDEELNNMFAKLKQRKTFNDLETRQLKNKIDSLKLKQKQKKKTPKAQGGIGQPSFGQGIDLPQGGEAYSSPGNQFFGIQEGASGMDQIGNVFNSDAMQNFGIPILGDAIKIAGQFKQQRNAEKDLKQMREVSGIARAAAMTKPEQIERDYVRPEDIQNTGEEFFPIYGVGTNVLAKNGATLFNNPDYAPIHNVNKAKTFMHGGYLPKGQGGFNAGNISYGGGPGSGIGMELGDAVGFNNDAGSNVGGTIGGTIGSAFGPIGSAVGSFIGSGIGDLLDKSDSRQKMYRKDIDRNVRDMSNMQVGPQIHAGYASHVRKGGRVPSPNNDYGMIGAPGPQVLNSFDGKNLNNMLQKASRMPDTLKQGGSVSGNGDVKTLWGGDVNAVSYNPYAGGQSMYFSGNSHDYRDPETGETGIGVAYGPQSVANNEPVVEVENEPAQILEENGKENLVIYGDLKIPKGYASEIGDEKAGGQKFKNYVNNLNDEEARINKQMVTAVDNAADIDNTKWGELLRSTSDAIINGGDMKLKNIANKKKVLSDLQSALNDTFEENGIEGNKFITKGVLEDIKDTEDYAKNGKKETYTDYAEDGRKIPKAQNDGRPGPDEGLTLNELPFKSAEEAIAAGYTLDEDKNSENFGKYYIDEESSEMLKDFELSFMTDIPENQEFGGSDIGKMVNKKITSEEYNKWKKDNKWFFDKNPDWRADTKEDVKLFQREFNKVNPSKAKTLNSIKVDGLFGDQTISARFKSENSETPKTVRRYRDVEVGEEEEEITTEETTTVKGKIPFDPSLLKPLFEREVENDLDYNQILPEMNAAANNQLDPVYAQSFQPRLRVPYDISMQDQMNEITAATRAATQNPMVQNNPALLAALQAPQYEAINKVKAEEFRANQQMKDTVYSGNIETLNQARMTNLGIYDQQQTRQAQAVANTKATQQEIVKSISDKYQRNKLENRTEKVLSNLFPNYDFNESLDLNNQGSTNFSIPNILGGQAGNTGGGLNSIINAIGMQGFQQLMRTAGFNPNPNQTTTDTTTARHGAKLTPIKRKVKKNQRNSNILREYKNL